MATAVAITAAVVAAGSAYYQGKSERDALKHQYEIEEYNAQMDKMEKEVDLARQDKLLQKQLAESMATTNNLFGDAGFSSDAYSLIEGTFAQGQDETRSIKAQEEHVQNKYITTSAMRRKAFNKNMRNNAISTGLNMISSGISGYASGYQAAGGGGSGGGKGGDKGGGK